MLRPREITAFLSTEMGNRRRSLYRSMMISRETQLHMHPWEVIEYPDSVKKTMEQGVPRLCRVIQSRTADCRES